MSARSGKPYSEMGKLLDRMARKRDVRGPYNVSQRVVEATGYRITGQAVSRYFYGDSWPKREFIAAFARTFDLNAAERDELARMYAYGPFDEGFSQG